MEEAIRYPSSGQAIGAILLRPVVWSELVQLIPTRFYKKLYPIRGLDRDQIYPGLQVAVWALDLSGGFSWGKIVP